MKKALVIILSIVMVIAAFAGCSAKKNNNDQTGGPKNTSSVAEEWQKTTITTDNAKISNNDAIEYIKSYSAKELSLTDEEMKECDFMFSGTGVKIKNDYYVKVSAIVKHEKGKDGNGNPIYTFDNKGEYYIRYDGKQVLKKDMTKNTNEYTELKAKKIPEKTTAKAEKTTEKAKDTTAKAESTTKK